MPSPKRESVINANYSYRHFQKTQDIYRKKDRKNFTYKTDYHTNPKKNTKYQKQRNKPSLHIEHEIQFALNSNTYPIVKYQE